MTNPNSLHTTTNASIVSSGLSCLRSIPRVLERSSTDLDFGVLCARECVEERIVVASRIPWLWNIIIRRYRQSWLKVILSVQVRLWQSRPSRILWCVKWRRIGFRGFGNYELSCVCRRRYKRYVWLPKGKWERLIACEKPSTLVNNSQHFNQCLKILNIIPLAADFQLHWGDPDDVDHCG